MLRAIHITKLFGIFDYSIHLKEEGITILTGPNGYGKTTILKIIHAIAKKNLLYFFNLSFDQIDLILEETDRNIRVEKLEKESEKVLVIYQGGNKLIQTNSDDLVNKLKLKLRRADMWIERVSEKEWLDHRTERVFSLSTLIEDILPRYSDQLDIFEGAFQFPTIPEVYLIKEQRLLRKVEQTTRRRYVEEGTTNYFSETIEEYSKELKTYILGVLASYSQITQQLDSSFPKRLFDEQNAISKESFDARFKEIRNVQKALSKYELSVIQEDNHPTYKQENAKALAVYLEDTEEKLKVFRDLLKKLNLFTSILNERRFAFKQIHVSREDGFKFLISDDEVLPLTELSSGEQQEVVLLFELLFRVKPNTLVLIDEPEISLHVAWQKEFLNDLIKIAELQEVEVIVATHSPQIINERWDLTVDLEELIHETVS